MFIRQLLYFSAFVLMRMIATFAVDVRCLVRFVVGSEQYGTSGDIGGTMPYRAVMQGMGKFVWKESQQGPTVSIGRINQ
jgi:hypothetical protein